MSWISINVNTSESDNRISGFMQQDSTSQFSSQPGLVRVLEALSRGALNLEEPEGSDSTPYLIDIGNVRATATVTFTGLPTAAQAYTLANVAFTARASGAVNNEFNIGADAGATGDNLAAAINASTTEAINKVFRAESDGAGVVTVTCLVPGLVGLGIAASENLSNATITQFAGGDNGEQYIY
ncbi:hypothetical protein [Leptospira johnsonii]|uniref:Uncharacterized protein n=1 Tax=Leptospira johnsonii TaxID=1917820 RepID=A0A2P2D7T3_9LEPT|nr:hypothetical protein [Leptospira johnsonii]GBF40692.1 hypothetical protein LPTSP1_37100 [Leptospira johnsonii]